MRPTLLCRLGGSLMFRCACALSLALIAGSVNSSRAQGVTRASCDQYGPPACAPYEDNNGPLLKGDPLLDGRLFGETAYGPSPITPGWFGAVQINAVAPHVTEQMFAYVGPFKPASPPVLGTSGFHLPFHSQDWSVSPLFQLGYRFAEGAGGLQLSYQFLNSTGSGAGTDGFGNPAALQSRLNVNSADFQYSSREFSLGPLWDMKWYAGIRGASIFFDSHAVSSAANQAISNDYWGVGPVFGLNLARHFVGTGLDAFCRGECAILYGPVTQNFDAGGGATLEQSHHSVSFVPKIEAGAGWTPPSYQRLHFTAGYTFQYWSNIAEFQTFANPDSQPTSRGSLMIQGVFLRAEWNY